MATFGLLLNCSTGEELNDNVVDEDDPTCSESDKAALAAPTVLEPADRPVDIRADNLKIMVDALPYVGQDVVFDVEMNRVKSSETERVWLFRGEVASGQEIVLSDGQFAAGVDELKKWKNYEVRTRVQEKGECRWSEWSDGLPFRTDDGSTQLFDDGFVHEISLEIPDDSFSAINAQSRPQGCTPLQRDYHPGTVQYDDMVFEGSGIRGKGGCGSSRRLVPSGDRNGKSSFKSNMSWDNPDVQGCGEERRLFGLKRLALNNQVQDPTYISERLTYFLYKEVGLPSARVAPVRTVVNGDLWGLYLNVETMDRRFLSRWFDSNDGMMYEGTYDCDFDKPEDIPEGEDDIDCFTKKFDTDECSEDRGPDADPTTYALLIDMMAEVSALSNSNFYPAVTEIFDFDKYLTLLAVDTIVDSFDSYHYRIGNNYRVYHDPSTDKWTMFPQGVDQTFGSGGRRFINPFRANKAFLARRCINNSQCKDLFATRLQEVLVVFENANLEAMVRDIQNQIRSDVRADPRKEISNSEWEDAVDDMIDFIQDRPGEVREYLSDEGY